jgi:hypothetical protein
MPPTETIKTVDPQAELRAQIAALTAQNEVLKARAEKSSSLSVKIGEKGGLSVYGLGRFPVTLYKSQWIRLLVANEMIAAFIKAHDSELKEKAA